MYSCLKVLDLISAAIVALVLGTTAAHAYIDPGTGSMMLQGLIALIAGLALGIRLKWQAIKEYFHRRSKNRSSQENGRVGTRHED